MSDELARAFEFMTLADMFGTVIEPSPFGTAVRSPELPMRQDSNYLLVDHTDAPAYALAEETKRLRLRAVFVPDEETGLRLEGEFAALSWKTHRGVLMAHHRSPHRAAGDVVVTEVGEGDLRPLRRLVTLSYPWGTPELAEQRLRGKVMISQRVETHFFAVLVSGEVAAYTDLYVGDGIAQIEDVYTVERYRRRGYASALVLRGLEEARRADAALVFLAADADDWPKELYGRLGFDVIGRYTKFFP
jgi:ribosomal protein S18 acetylase RimI-like enzyme